MSLNAFETVFVKSQGQSGEHKEISIAWNNLSMFSQYVNNPLYFVLHPIKSFDLPVLLAHRHIIEITKQKMRARQWMIENYEK